MVTPAAAATRWRVAGVGAACCKVVGALAICCIVCVVLLIGAVDWPGSGVAATAGFEVETVVTATPTVDPEVEFEKSLLEVEESDVGALIDAGSGGISILLLSKS